MALMKIVATMKTIPIQGNAWLAPSFGCPINTPLNLSQLSTKTCTKLAIISTEKMTTPRGSKFFLPRGYLK